MFENKQYVCLVMISNVYCFTIIKCVLLYNYNKKQNEVIILASYYFYMTSTVYHKFMCI